VCATIPRVPDRRRRVPPVAIGIALLVVVSAGAVVALTRLGDDGEDDAVPATGSSSTTSTTRPPPTTTTEPRPTSYVVQQGDNLTAIANEFRVAPTALALLNRLTDQDRLTPGQRLEIPPAPPLRLRVQPATTIPASSVRIVLTGARPGESLTFEIRKPDGVFRGSPHLASTEGRVETSYTVDADDVPGFYVIAARGDLGTELEAALAVTPPPPPAG
jgi:LysM repeat protein